jgi:hypothetical protein
LIQKSYTTRKWQPKDPACCIPNNPQNEWGWQPSLFVQSVSYSFWILSQIAIVLAKIYVTEWAVWYGFMQGLLAVTFVWYTIFVSKCTERIRCWGYFFFLQIAGLQTVTSILSYASVLHNLYRHPHLGYSVSSAFFLPLFIYLIVFSILAAIFGRCCRWIWKTSKRISFQNLGINNFFKISTSKCSIFTLHKKLVKYL